MENANEGNPPKVGIWMGKIYLSNYVWFSFYSHVAVVVKLQKPLILIYAELN